MSAPRPRKLVVAALMRDEGGRVLLTRRRDDQPMGGMWEFPGGKIESGESPAQALAREISEELGVRITVGTIYDVLHHAYPEFDLLMLVYRCEVEAGELPRAVEVAEVAYVLPRDLDRYEILPADAPLLDRLRTE